MLPTAGTFLGWRDDFNDTSRVAASSNVVFSGTDVRLSNSSNLSRVGLMLGLGGPGDFDAGELGGPSVLFDQGIYRMWYFGSPGAGNWRVGYADSPDGRVWTKRGVVVSPSIPTDAASVAYSEVVKVGSQYRMYYSGSDGSRYRIHLATSADGLVWAKQGVVLDVGPPGSQEDGGVFEPSVIVQAGTYYIWYAGLSSSGGGVSIFFATSLDGLSWTRRGMVLPHGPPGSIDQIAAEDPSVRIVGTTYEMLYAAVYGPGVQLALAESADGVSWQKKGSVLDLAPPDESTVLSTPFIHLEPDGTWNVYYAARGASLQIFLAVRPSAPKTGWLQSQAVGIPAGLDWAWFNQSAVVPANTWLNVSVRDAATGSFLTGFENATAGSIDLRTVDPTLYPRLEFEGWLSGNGSATPVLDSWEVRWTDQRQPSFAGLALATDLGTSGSVRLAWSAAVDPSPPVLYRIYQAHGGDPFDYSTVAYNTAATTLDVTGLTDGDAYRFVVRAEDIWGNEDTNTVERTVIPTTPLDSVPPDFGGLLTATDARTGGAVRLSWSAASDPDTPASNSDPSLPIRYWVYLNRSGTPIDFTSPQDSTTGISIIVTGLTDGDAYDFVVRATDDRGNQETNSVLKTAIPTTPVDSVPPDFGGLLLATDARTGGAIRLSWSAASDPDTPASNSDPSLPIRYWVFMNRSGSPIDFSAPLDSTTDLSIIVTGLTDSSAYDFAVRAVDASGNGETNTILRTATPTTPVDSVPPSFAGLATATDARTGGSVRLSWTAALDPDTASSNSDPSLPIRYWIFEARSGSPIDFALPEDSTTDLSIVVSGLTDGVAYDFVVRAVDAAGNGESNSVVRRATPTRPYDTTPPNFLGIDSVIDLGTGERIRVAWLPGSDPDTPESNVDPSLPLTYSVWVAENTGQLGAGPASGTTTSTSLEIGGLRPGHTYYVLVRATDSAGNMEANARVLSVEVREQSPSTASYSWILAILVGIVILLVAIVVWRRRRKPATPPSSPPSGT